MVVTAIDDKARKYIKSNSIVACLEKKKFLDSIIVRFNNKNELRVFIREEIGRTQFVAWLSEKEIQEWIDSETQAYMHFLKKRRNENAKESCLTN